jgi:type IV pilus assembly protein PilX
MMRIGLKNQSGAALVIALIMLIVLTLIGLASTFTSTFEMKLSGNKRGSTNAFYAADSGIQVVMANISNFNMPGKYVDNKYNPFTETNPNSPDYNPNPTNASVTISFDPNQQGAPRGTGISATSFEFNHYLLESTGRDQIDMSYIRSKCNLEEKVVRLIPTLQGGY